MKGILIWQFWFLEFNFWLLDLVFGDWIKSFYQKNSETLFGAFWWLHILFSGIFKGFLNFWIKVVDKFISFIGLLNEMINMLKLENSCSEIAWTQATPGEPRSPTNNRW